MIPPKDQLCKLCKSYRALKDVPGRGECRNGPAPFRGMPHNGEGYLGVWGHVREDDECQAFEAAPPDQLEPEPPPAEPASDQVADVSKKVDEPAALSEPDPGIVIPSTVNAPAEPATLPTVAPEGPPPEPKPPVVPEPPAPLPPKPGKVVVKGKGKS